MAQATEQETAHANCQGQDSIHGTLTNAIQKETSCLQGQETLDSTHCLWNPTGEHCLVSISSACLCQMSVRAESSLFVSSLAEEENSEVATDFFFLLQRDCSDFLSDLPREEGTLQWLALCCFPG